MKFTNVQIACKNNKLPSQEQIDLWFNTACLSDNGSINIRFVDSAESQELNLNYRDKDKPTNVLSFEFEIPEFIDPAQMDYLLGDLAICADVVELEALDQNKVLFDHYAHMIIHGALHLQGYDHIDEQEAEEMESLERKLLKTLNIDDPYQSGMTNE